MFLMVPCGVAVLSLKPCQPACFEESHQAWLVILPMLWPACPGSGPPGSGSASTSTRPWYSPAPVDNPDQVHHLRALSPVRLKKLQALTLQPVATHLATEHYCSYSKSLTLKSCKVARFLLFFIKKKKGSIGICAIYRVVWRWCM